MRYIGRQIDKYMAYFRCKFPEVCVILKQHLLEDHCVENLSRLKVGFGLMTEQGIESIHHTMNDACITMKGIKTPASRLHSAIQEHYISTLPHIKVLYPQPKEKKL